MKKTNIYLKKIMRPSKINVLKAKKALFLFPGFRALTWKGIAYCKKECDIQLINAKDTIDSNFEAHEMSHVKQAESTHNSWFCFYVLYLWYWVLNFPLFIYGAMMPYYFIPFELEAFINEIDHTYPTHGAVNGWRKFKPLTISEKFKLANMYNNSYKPIGFKQFVRKIFKANEN
jgi:hypothetical protein